VSNCTCRHTPPSSCRLLPDQESLR
jgi:hypothetical protein